MFVLNLAAKIQRIFNLSILLRKNNYTESKSDLLQLLLIKINILMTFSTDVHNALQTPGHQCR